MSRRRDCLVEVRIRASDLPEEMVRPLEQLLTGAALLLVHLGRRFRDTLERMERERPGG